MPHEPWVCVEDVASHLGIPKDTLYPLTDPKQFHAQKMGRLCKFQLSDLDAWITASDTKSSGSESATLRSGKNQPWLT
jgi:excisionase family DNA binding protein